MSSGLLPPAVQEFVADSEGFVSGLKPAIDETKKFAGRVDEASLSVRRMGLTAEKASRQAAAAQRKAADAARKVRDGELEAAEATRLATDAAHALEDAEIKAAAAQRLAARAAKDQAAAQRKAAITAGAEHLAALRSVGAVREHNAALRRLRGEYHDFDKVAGTAFRDMERLGGRAFGLVQRAGTSAFEGVSSAASSLAETGPGMIALIVGALAAVPFAAAAAESAITLGVGGALIGIGLEATKSDRAVQSALHGMTSHIKDETKRIAKPFKATWLEIAHDGQVAFDSLEPSLQKDFAKLAPAMSRFAHEGATAIGELSPALDAATNGATRLMDALGPKLPGIARDLGSSIQIMGNSVAQNADAFASLFANVAKILPVLAAFLDYTTRLAPAVSPLFDVMTRGTDTLRSVGDGLHWLTGGLIGTSHSLKTASGDFPAFTTGASGASAESSKLADDMKTLASNTATAADRTNALTDAFQRLVDPEKAVFGDTAKLRDDMIALNKALKDSHGRMNDNSKSARAAKQAFIALLSQTEQMASDMTNAGHGVDYVRHRLQPYIADMYRTAGSNRQARALVDAFVRSLQGVPSKKGTHLYSNAEQEREAVRRYQQQINALHGKRVTIEQIIRTVHYTSRQLVDRTSGPGRYGATGGRWSGSRFHYAGGGEVSGLVLGPGTGTSDSIPAPWLSNEEFVVNSRDARQNLSALMALNRGLSWMQAARYAPHWGLAKGGSVDKAVGGGSWTDVLPTAGWHIPANIRRGDARLAWARARPEALAALAAQQSLAAMRHSILGGIAGGALGLGSGSGAGTIVQHVTHVDVHVAGSIRSDRDLVAMIQQQLMLNRRSVTLPSGR